MVVWYFASYGASNTVSIFSSVGKEEEILSYEIIWQKKIIKYSLME